MDKINIIVKLNSQDTNYNYKGNAYINKDIIEYFDEDCHYIFDKKIKRLIKSREKTSIILDFQNEELKIIDNNNEVRTKIEVEKIEISKNNIIIVYKIDKNKFIYRMKEVKSWVILKN